jgi:LysM repeat protein
VHVVASPVRLTRRGRLAVTLVLAAAAAGVLGAAAPQALALGQQNTAVAQRVTVQPGETLWGLAERAAPGADPRETVARIESMNDLTSSSVPAGRVLLVPAR